MSRMALIECILAVLSVLSVVLYSKAAEHKKNTILYGIMFDFSGIHLIAIPIIHAAYQCFKNNGGTAYSVLLSFVIIVYLTVIFLDVRYLISAYRKIKEIRQKRTGGKNR